MHNINLFEPEACCQKKYFVTI